MPKSEVQVLRAPYGRLQHGTPVEQFTLRNPHGIELRAIAYGGIVVSLRTPDRRGILGDIVLGYDTLAEYITNPAYFGAIIGRYANRIAQGRFTLDNDSYQLTTNNGSNHLHGGVHGFDKVLWRAESFQDPGRAGIRFGYTSPEGEEGYPGRLLTEVRYSLTEEDQVIVDYQATTDRATVVNLTQHTYFNLAGEGNGDVLAHQLMIDADYYTPIDPAFIPTGELASVAGTPFDFRTPTAIGARIDEDHPQLRTAHGYDHNFVLNRPGSGPRQVARLSDPGSGRVVELSTTEPGLHVYTANFVDGIIGKEGHCYGHRSGVTLETQHFPDSPNRPEFPSTILRPGDEYRSRTMLTFGLTP